MKLAKVLLVNLRSLLAEAKRTLVDILVSLSFLIATMKVLWIELQGLLR